MGFMIGLLAVLAIYFIGGWIRKAVKKITVQ